MTHSDLWSVFFTPTPPFGHPSPRGKEVNSPLQRGVAHSDVWGVFFTPTPPYRHLREEQVDLILLLSGHWHIFYDLLYFINPQAMAWNTFQLNIVPQENISLLEVMIYQY